MQDWYYSDKRDLVKWSVLLRLAEQHRFTRIIQIAYLRPSVFHMIDIAGQQSEIPLQVRRHFRNIRNVATLDATVSISVFDRAFDDRIAYGQALTQYLAVCGNDLRLIFLDPDIGLEPANSPPDLRHVLGSEARAIWSQLNANEVFAFYQHKTNRAGRPWIEQKRTQLENAIQVRRGTVSVAQSPAIADDVVIYFAVKP